MKESSHGNGFPAICLHNDGLFGSDLRITLLSKSILCLMVSITFTFAASAQQADTVQQPGDEASATIAVEASADTSSQKGDISSKRATRRSNAYGTRLETDPPGYAKPMSEHGRKYGIDSWSKLDWLDLGIEHRTRFELRDDDYSRGGEGIRDEKFVLRSRVYLGIHDICDPFRFGLEVQDARQFNSRFDESNRDVDETDILQLYGELYFADLIAPGCPLRLQAGRMSFDYVDRKLVGRNRWRNTVNAFDGFRVQLGQPSHDWQLDFFAVMPVERLVRQLDRSDDERWFYGLVGAWSGWPDFATLEPYYFVLDEDRKEDTRDDREIHTVGLHAFGPIHGTHFDYDVDAALQFGSDGPRTHRALAVYGELGYSFAHAWKPRLSISGTYGSGDRDPDDNTSERFDRLFAPNHFRSTSDLFNWQNIISPKLRVEVRPLEKLRIDAAYGSYWLASDNDAWTTPGRSDSTGHSGDFVGQELEIRTRYQLNDNVELEVGYSYFMPGEFVRNTASADDSDLFYTAVTFKF